MVYIHFKALFSKAFSWVQLRIFVYLFLFILMVHLKYAIVCSGNALAMNMWEAELIMATISDSIWRQLARISQHIVADLVLHVLTGNVCIFSYYSDVIMSVILQITGVSIVYWNRLFRPKSKKTSKLRVTGLWFNHRHGFQVYQSVRSFQVQWNLSLTTTQWDTSLPSGAHLGGAPECRNC